MYLDGDNDNGGTFLSRLAEEPPCRLDCHGGHHLRQRLLNCTVSSSKFNHEPVERAQTRTKMGRLAGGEEGGIRTKLLGVAHVVYEQNLVAVTAASAPPVLEPSRVSSCVRTLHKSISEDHRSGVKNAWQIGRRWCTGSEEGHLLVLREWCRAETGRRLVGPALRRRRLRAPRLPSPSSAAAAELSGSATHSRGARLWCCSAK
jgi:hypothetical protein